MNKARHITLFAFVAMLSMLSCVKIDDVPSIQGRNRGQRGYDEFRYTGLIGKRLGDGNLRE